jgi:hypothetical protein
MISKKLTNEEIKIIFVSIMKQKLKKVGCFKELNNGLEFVFKEPYNDQFNNIIFNYTDEERAIRFLYNYLKSKNII